MIGARHALTILNPGVATSDSEGRATEPIESTIVTRGSVDEISARDIVIAAKDGQTFDLACRVDRDLDVSSKSLVVVTEPARLAGTYKVDVVRTLQTHLRLLCSKTTVRS